MAWNLIKTEAFQEDFEELVAYYAIAASKKGLTKFVDSIEGATRFLAENPMIHSVSRKFYLSSGGYREHFVGNYVIIYRIEGLLVILCRLFHQRRNYQQFVIEW